MAPFTSHRTTLEIACLVEHRWLCGCKTLDEHYEGDLKPNVWRITHQRRCDECRSGNPHLEEIWTINHRSVVELPKIQRRLKRSIAKIQAAADSLEAAVRRANGQTG